MSDANRLDRLISWLDPARGLRRAQMRAASSILLSYDGAHRGARQQFWRADGGDANADFPLDLQSLRDRSSEQIRNNPLARRMKSVVTKSAIQTGINDYSDTGNEELDDQIDAALTTWKREECDAAGQSTWGGLQLMAMGAMFERGAALARLRIRRAADGLSIPLQVQMLEADYIDMDKNEDFGAAGSIVQGVQTNQIGKRSAYWLYRNHPGSSNGFGVTASRSVPANQVIHCYVIDRPGQVHGVPFMASTLMNLKDLDDRKEAEVVLGKVAACLGLWVEQEGGVSGGPVGIVQNQSDGERLETLGPGMVHYGRAGEKPTLLSPPEHKGYREFMQTQEEMLAVAVDMFYAQLSGNLANVNWSSYRAGDRDFVAMINSILWLVFIPMFTAPIRRAAIDVALLSGAIRVNPALLSEVNPYGVRWAPQPRLSVDPGKDADARNQQMKDGSLLLTDVIAASGENPKDYLNKIDKLTKELQDRGITFDWMQGMLKGDENNEQNSEDDI